MDTLEPVIADKDKQVVDVRHKFARKRYAREYRWEPSPGIEPRSGRRFLVGLKLAKVEIT